MMEKNYYAQPHKGEYSAYYATYIQLVKENNLLDALKNGLEHSVDFLDSLPADVWSYRYAPGKWTVKDILGHLIDAERIFMYRALTFARADRQLLPGFDENSYVQQAYADLRAVNDLMEEYILVRKSSVMMLKGLPPENLLMMGTANAQPVSVRAIAYIVAGHEMHHLRVIKERYLQ